MDVNWVVIYCCQGDSCWGNWFFFAFLGYLSTAESHVQSLKIPSLKITILQCSFFLLSPFCKHANKQKNKGRVLLSELHVPFISQKDFILFKELAPCGEADKWGEHCWILDLFMVRHGKHCQSKGWYSLFSDCTAYQKLPSSVKLNHNASLLMYTLLDLITAYKIKVDM